MPATPPNPEVPVSQWIEAFNVRDLDGMLARMSLDVLFCPLRLDELERCYHGHDGVRNWFVRLDELSPRYTIGLRSIRGESSGEVIAIGELLLEGDPEPARFWARDQVEDGLIVVAHHYLTDPDVFDGIRPSRRSPPFPEP